MMMMSKDSATLISVGGAARGERRMAENCPDSLGFDARELHYRAPLVSFIRDKLPEVRGRARNHHDTQVGKPRLHIEVREARIDLLVELVDDLDGRVFRRAHTEPSARLIGRQEVTHSGNIG